MRIGDVCPNKNSAPTSASLIEGLVIFPVPGNNTFETPNFADPRLFFFKEQGCASLSHSAVTEKNIKKHERNDFVFSLQRVFLFLSFEGRKIKEQTAEKRIFLDLQINFQKCCIYQANLYK